MAFDSSQIPPVQRVYLWDPDTGMPLGSNSLGLTSIPQVPFYRMGEPFVIPVSPTSAADEFPIAVPEGAMCFQWTNNNPFSVRLRGRRQGGAFTPVTAKTGWLWLPGTQGVRSSLMPISVSAMSVDGPNASVQAAQKAGSGFIELQYGMGLR